MEAHVLSLNEFNMPKVFEASDAMYMQIIRLLLLEPGKYQSHPKMGVGIISKYKYNGRDDVLINLKNDIINQINTYLPVLSGADITLTINKNNILGIIIDTSKGTYVVAYDSTTESLHPAATYVLDQL
jgi:hypothetical protein